MRASRWITASAYLCGALLFLSRELYAQEGHLASIATQRFWVAGAVGASTSATLDLYQSVWYNPGPILLGARRARSLVSPDDWHESAELLGLTGKFGPVTLSAAGGRSTARAVYKVYSDQSFRVDSTSGSGRALSFLTSVHQGIVGYGVEVFAIADGARVSRRGVALVVQLGVLEPWLHF